MSRRPTRFPEIQPAELRAIEDSAGRLLTSVTKAEASLRPFCKHYNELADLRTALKLALNRLNGRPDDYEFPR